MVAVVRRDFLGASIYVICLVFVKLHELPELIACCWIGDTVIALVLFRSVDRAYFILFAQESREKFLTLLYIRFYGDFDLFNRTGAISFWDLYRSI